MSSSSLEQRPVHPNTADVHSNFTSNSDGFTLVPSLSALSSKSLHKPDELWSTLHATLTAGHTLESRRKHAYQSKRNLWQEAVQSLELKNKPEVSTHDLDQFKPQTLQKDVEEKLAVTIERQWTFTNSKGEQVTIRSVFESIARWLAKFKDVGDVLMQYDPGHAALPWAAIRFLLQAVISDSQKYGSMVESVDRCASVIARFAEVESLHLQGNSPLKHQLANGLVKLYAAVLKSLSEAQQYFGASTAKRFFKAGIQSSASGVYKSLNAIKTEEADVLNSSRLVAEEDQLHLLRGVSKSVNRLVEETDKTPKISDEERRAQLVRWMNAISTDATLINNQSLRHQGTCEWIFKRKEFQDWSHNDWSKGNSKILWINAGPGFGKTVLCAHVLQHLIATGSEPVAYFFCVADDESSREPFAILRSWIAQLIEANRVALDVAYDMYKRSPERPLVDAELWHLFKSIASRIKCILVVDGYDECTTINKTSRFHTNDAKSAFLRSFIAELKSIQTQVVFVSRNTEDIATVFSLLSPKTRPALFECTVTAKDTSPDIMQWSASIVASELANKKQALQDEIAHSAAIKADGMFLWLHLLRQQLNPGENAKTLRRRVSDMPAGLDQAYQRDLDTILELQEDEKQRALTILRWIAFSVRPLTVRELAEALALSGPDADDEYPIEDLPDEWEDKYVDESYVQAYIRRPCGSLITLRARKPNQPVYMHTVHFVHFSVKEFLLRSDQSLRNSESQLQRICFNDMTVENNLLARLCLRYLCYDIFGEPEGLIDDDKIGVYPFLFYAARSWYSHAAQRTNGISHDVMPFLQKLFNPATSNWKLWSLVFEGEINVESDGDLDGGETDVEDWDSDDATSDTPLEESDAGPSTNAFEGSGDENSNGLTSAISRVTFDSTKVIGPDPFYYASLLGLTEIVKALAEEGLQSTAPGGIFGFPLQAAAASGHLDTVEYLISCGADINQTGGKYGCAIGAAAALNHKEMFHFLLDHGADPLTTANIDKDSHCFVLACRADALNIAQVIFDLGVSAEHLSLALYNALGDGNLEAAKFLLDHGADVDANPAGTLPLLAHAIILAYSERSNPDFDASSIDSRRFVKLLVEYKADVSKADEWGFTPLCFAAELSDTETMELLIKHGCDVGQFGKDGRTAFHLAASLGSVESGKTLLAAGADINATNASCMTVLHFAIYNGCLDFTKFALEHGVDVFQVTTEGSGAMEYCINEDKKDFLDVLLNYDILIAHGEWSLHDDELHPSGAQCKRETIHKIQKQILHHEETAAMAAFDEAPPTEKQEVLDSLVLAAACFGSAQLLEEVVDRGGNANAKNYLKRSALHFASYRGSEAHVLVLLKHKADLHGLDLCGFNPLELATKAGHMDTAKILIIHGTFETMTNNSSMMTTTAKDSHAPAVHKDLSDLKDLLDGNWSGHYEYQSWRRGVKEDTAIEIDLTTGTGNEVAYAGGLSKTPTWSYTGSDLYEFSVVGQVLVNSDNKIVLSWLKCYPQHGWFYSGILDEEACKETGQLLIKGHWGSNAARPHGTFELRKTTKKQEEKEVKS